ncbi:serine transporter family protein [Escherichia coli]|nr:serine transporter family protein [Escherichia coli]
MAPIIAIIAITKSFLGHYLGAREGFNGMVIKSLRGKGKSIGNQTAETVSLRCSCW